jgi:hypothetical protein
MDQDGGPGNRAPDRAKEIVMPRSKPRAQRWLATFSTIVLIVVAGLMPVASVLAAEPTDMVLVWNANAVIALSNANTATPPGAGQAPPVASIHLAMVQGAVYDAVNAIDGGHEAYLAGLPSAPANASKAAATAAAAHDVLIGLIPALPQNVKDSVEASYTSSLTAITPDNQAKVDGIAIGQAAAAAMLADRANDGRYGTFRFTAGTHVGEWRPELPSFVSDPFAWVARVRPFTMKSTSQFRTAGPLDMASPEYATEFNEVKTMGVLEGSSRTDAQTLEARFYATNPLPMMNRAFREVASARGLSITADARLFVTTSMSSADALIGCWDDKAYWSFWRPITAINQAADDGNPDTAPQAGWLPLIATGTAPYPDHPSGYNCFTAAMMHAAKGFFGTDKISFVLNSSLTGTSRSYDRFTRVMDDTIDARIWLGLHFRTPDVQGAELGKRAANWAAAQYFKPAH